MTRPKIPTINWRKELKILDRYIKSEGGVLHIKTTPDSPSSAFSKSIRNIMENNTWDRRWVTVQVDGDNAATHYLPDMILQLEVSNCSANSSNRNWQQYQCGRKCRD
jgi:hypothetical protein